MVPVQTGIKYIAHLQGRNNLFVKLGSGKAGMGFYTYDEEFYQFKEPVDTLSSAVGLMALALVFIRFLSPAGKLIIV